MATGRNTAIHLFLCGDVMTGRGIDQILPFPSDSTLHEPYAKDAAAYVELAERVNGPIPRRADASYIWGFALDEFKRVSPDVKIVNLETAVTASSDHWPSKAIHYRMNPWNVGCLTAAGIDCCTLANNHVLDWGYEGLQETLQTLQRTNIQFAGAGRTLREAQTPAIFEISNRQVIVFALAFPSSGVPLSWTAAENRPGVYLVDETNPDAVTNVCRVVGHFRRPDSLVVVSIHWGENWGYGVPPEQQQFARGLIDDAGVDVVFGHSSHHVKGLEVYKDKPIVYGAGDLLSDYEGISGYERYRGNLGLMYFATMDVTGGELLRLQLVPTRIKRFQLTRPSTEDVEWLIEVLNREGRPLGTSVVRDGQGGLRVKWGSAKGARSTSADIKGPD